MAQRPKIVLEGKFLELLTAVIYHEALYVVAELVLQVEHYELLVCDEHARLFQIIQVHVVGVAKEFIWRLLHYRRLRRQRLFEQTNLKLDNFLIFSRCKRLCHAEFV